MQNVLDALKAAGVPPFALKTNLLKEGQEGLRKFVADTEFKTAEGMQSYRLVGQETRDITRISAVLAKELVLSKAAGRTVYVPGALVAHHARFYERHGEYSEQTQHLAQLRCAVLPDLFSDEVSDLDRALTLQIVQRWYYSGVMLVIGDWRNGTFGSRSFVDFASGLPALNIA